MKFVIALMSCMLPSLAIGATQKATPLGAQASLTTLGKIDAESDEAATVITIRFDRKPDWDKLQMEEHGTFLQFSMPGVFAPNPGEFVDTPSPVVAKAGVFQPKTDVTSVRLFVRKEAADVLQASTLDVLDNRAIFRLDHKKLEQIIAARATPTLTGAVSSGDAEKVIANTEVRNDIPAPAQMLQGSAEGQVAVGSNVANLKHKMIGVAIFCGVMLSILLGLQVLRPFLRKARKNKEKAGPQFSIQTIATQALSPKQKLAVVEVGGQRFLLGITPEHISLVSELQVAAAPAVSRVAALATAAPQRMLESGTKETGKIIHRQRSIAQKSKSISAQESAPRALERTALPVAKKAASPSRINVAIGDDGVVNRGGADNRAKTASSSAVEDVTKMIREKLNKLSSLPT